MSELLRALCAIVLTFALGAAAASAADPRPVVRIGLVDTFSPEFYIHTYAQTVQYLKEHLPQYRFESVEFSDDSELTPVSTRGLDFLVSSAGTFGIRSHELGIEHIVIRKRADVSDASESVAAVFIARASDKRIRSLEDMRNKRAAATTASSFDGWLIAKDALAQAGFSAEDFFSSVLFTEYNFPDVVSLVLAKRADVGVLTRCQLESLTEQGLVNPADIAVINAVNNPEERCKRSTELFPAEVFAVFPHTDSDLAKAVTIALLQMPADGQGDSRWQWVTVNNLVNVSGLLERLALGDYAWKREFTLQALAARYRTELILAAALIAAVLFHIFLVDRLVMQRTRELHEALSEKEALLVRMKRTQQYLQLLERNTIVSQLSSLFAHELKQPVTNIINYAAGLSMLRRSGRNDPAVLDEGLVAIKDQAGRIGQIVDRVRAYARREPIPKAPCRLFDIVQTTLENFRLAQKSVSTVTVDVPGNLYVLAEPVSLELLLLNLINNAERAARQSPDPRVRIQAEARSGFVHVTVVDNGPRVDEALFKQLAGVGGFRSAHGLGLGLTIAKGIAENHNGHMEFSRSQDGGLAATLVLPLLSDTENEKNAHKPSP